MGLPTTPHAPTCGCGALVVELSSIRTRARRQLGRRLGEEYARNMAVVEAAEETFLRRAVAVMGERKRRLLKWVAEGYTADGRPDPSRLLRAPDLPGDMVDMFLGFAGRMYAKGISQAKRDLFTAILADKREGLGDEAEETSPRVALSLVTNLQNQEPGPHEAIEYILTRRDLLRFFDADLVEEVRTTLARIVDQGLTLPDARAELESTLSHYTRARLTNVVRTESMTAFNAGKLAYFDARPHLVAGVRFVAVMDHRTTVICIDRNGIHLPLSHPLVRANTPPLHYQCRSTWSPLTRRRWQRVITAAYGPPMSLQEAEARFIADNVARLRAAKPVMKGFGGNGAGMGAEIPPPPVMPMPFEPGPLAPPMVPTPSPPNPPTPPTAAEVWESVKAEAKERRRMRRAQVKAQVKAGLLGAWRGVKGWFARIMGGGQGRGA